MSNQWPVPVQGFTNHVPLPTQATAAPLVSHEPSIYVLLYTVQCNVFMYNVYMCVRVCVLDAE